MKRASDPRLQGRVVVMIAASGYRPLHRRERMLPNGAIDLVFDLTDRSKALFASASGPEVTRFRGAWISGLRQTPLIIEATADTDFVIARLSVSGAYALLGGALGEIADRVLPLDALPALCSNRTRERLLETQDTATRLQLLEDWLAESMCHTQRRQIGWMTEVIARAPTTPLPALAEHMGYSQRHLRQTFRDQTGLSPKRFQRLMRFRAVLETLSSGRGDSIEDRLLSGARLASPGWADMAARFGYSDQSHLSAEFTTFAGLSPGRYVDQFRGMTDHLPL